VSRRVALLAAKEALRDTAAHTGFDAADVADRLVRVRKQIRREGLTLACLADPEDEFGALLLAESELGDFIVPRAPSPSAH